MSDKTLNDVEEAIRAHFYDELSDPEHPRHGKGDMVIDWVVGFTVSNIVDVDGKDVVGYANRHIAPLGNPNSHVALAAWVADDINSIMHPDDED